MINEEFEKWNNALEKSGVDIPTGMTREQKEEIVGHISTILNSLQPPCYRSAVSVCDAWLIAWHGRNIAEMVEKILTETWKREVAKHAEPIVSETLANPVGAEPAGIDNGGN